MQRFIGCASSLQYCEYMPEPAKCRQWLEKNFPDVFARMTVGKCLREQLRGSGITQDLFCPPSGSETRELDMSCSQSVHDGRTLRNRLVPFSDGGVSSGASSLLKTSCKVLVLGDKTV